MANNEEMTPPGPMPEKGFYYHYKHDPAGPFNNYAYEVLGTGCDTEGDWSTPDAYFVIYRSLYEDSAAFRAGKLWDLRPLTMFMGDVTKSDGMNVPRFHKIANPEIIAELTEKRREMYREEA